MTWQKWLSYYLYFFLFYFLLDLLYKEEVQESVIYQNVTVSHQKKCDISHDECGKVVHRPCSSYISSVQEINKNSIKFSLSTWTWSRFKSPWLEPYSKG